MGALEGTTDPALRNVGRGLIDAAPEVARAEKILEAGGGAKHSIADAVSDAVEKLVEIRLDYENDAAGGARAVTKVLKEKMHDLSPLAEEALRFIHANRKKPGVIRDGLVRWARLVEETKQGDEWPTPEALFERAAAEHGQADAAIHETKGPEAANGRGGGVSGIADLGGEFIVDLVRRWVLGDPTQGPRDPTDLALPFRQAWKWIKRHWTGGGHFRVARIVKSPEDARKLFGGRLAWAMPKEIAEAAAENKRLSIGTESEKDGDPGNSSMHENRLYGRALQCGHKGHCE